MATSVAKLRAVIEADTSEGTVRVREFGQEVQRTRASVDTEVRGMAGSFKSNLGSLVSEFAGGFGLSAASLGTGGLAVLAAGAAKAAWDLGTLGEQVERSDKYFTAFSGSASAARANLAAIRDATNGALSNQEAMNASSQLMSMGLAKNATELERTAHMAVMLGGNTRTASEAINEFALLLANQSVERLDTFGISSGQVRARIDELQAATKGLSRETAFMQAVMEIGAAKVQQLEAAGVEAGTSTDRLSAAWKNLRDEMAVPVTGVVKIIKEGAADVVQGAANALSAEVANQRAIAQALAMRQQALRDLADVQATHNEAVKQGDQYIADATAEGIKLAEAQIREAEAMLQTNVAIAAQNGWLDANRTLADTAAGAQDRLAEATTRAAAALDAQYAVSRYNNRQARAASDMDTDSLRTYYDAGDQRATWTAQTRDAKAEQDQKEYQARMQAIEKAKREQETATKKAQSDWESATKQMANDFKGALQGVPGLFNTSQVTPEDMAAAKAGVYEPKADEYLRRLRDQVINKKDQGIDLADAASRVGMAPGTNPEAILAQMEKQWNSGALFANPNNLDLINWQAVNADVAQQRAGQQGKQNIYAKAGGMLGLQGDALTQLLGGDNQFLAGQTAGLAKTVQGEFLKQLQQEAQGQPSGIATLLLGGKTEGGDAGPDVAAFIPALLTNVDKALTANADKAKTQGGQYWDYFEQGMIDKATQSGALFKAVDALVEESLKSKLPGYQS